VDFNYESRKEIVRVPRGFGIQDYIEGVDPKQGELVDFEDRWTGGYLLGMSGRASVLAIAATSSSSPPGTLTTSPGATPWPSK
jgi:hypothetical protein